MASGWAGRVVIGRDGYIVNREGAPIGLLLEGYIVIGLPNNIAL